MCNWPDPKADPPPNSRTLIKRLFSVTSLPSAFRNIHRRAIRILELILGLADGGGYALRHR